MDRRMKQNVRGCGANVTGSDHRDSEIRSERPDGVAHLVDCVCLGKRVFHEICGAKIEHIRAADLVELLFEIMQADNWAGSAREFGSDAAERNNVLNSALLHCGGD